MTAIAELPGPRSLPGIGSAHRLRPDRLHVMIEQWGRRYGPVFRFDIANRRIVGFTESAAIGVILRDRPDGFSRWSDLHEVLAELEITGVFSAEGDDWRRQRALAVRALNTDHLHRYFAVIRVATERLHARLERAARAGEPFEILDDLFSYSVDVTSALAFGHDLNTLERGDSELQRHIARVFPMLSRRVAAPFPYWRWVKLPPDRAGERSLAALRAAIEGFIAAARERMDSKPELWERPENFLESMLAAQLGGHFSDEEVLGNVFTMLLAGEDTTAHTLAWASYLLARAPAAQARLATEARDVLGSDRRAASAEAADAMRYGEGVLREAMRLKSVAPLAFVEALADTTVAGVELPAGTRVIGLTRQAALQEATFPDPTRFDPARWLDGNGGHDQKAFLPFGAGPRFCPGRNLAFLEAKAALAMLTRNFEITLAGDGRGVRERYGFTMSPAGLRVVLRERAA